MGKIFRFGLGDEFHIDVIDKNGDINIFPWVIPVEFPGYTTKKSINKENKNKLLAETII